MDNVVRTLADIQNPYRVLYSMAENQLYRMWIEVPKNSRKVVRAGKTKGIRKIARGPVDKYGKLIRRNNG